MVHFVAQYLWSVVLKKNIWETFLAATAFLWMVIQNHSTIPIMFIFCNHDRYVCITKILICYDLTFSKNICKMCTKKAFSWKVASKPISKLGLISNENSADTRITVHYKIVRLFNKGWSEFLTKKKKWYVQISLTVHFVNVFFEGLFLRKFPAN